MCRDTKSVVRNEVVAFLPLFIFALVLACEHVEDVCRLTP